ncbi:hypothetical protein C8F01DRAFT_1372892 [Mycena amicta]|nr:hypothetical protein C8F01DRAFT_1372892 [Mycena amicta]
MNVHGVRVLRIQELCDMIAELLAEKDLVRVAPLSRAFAGAAQRLLRLLHTVCFQPGAFNDFEALGGDDEEIMSQKLATLLRRSPGLTILAFEEDVLRPLDAINLALIHPHFANPAAFTELLAKHTRNLTGLAIVHPLTADSRSSAASPSLLVLQKLHFDADKSHDHRRLLLPPTSAIDTSVLEELSLGPSGNITAERLLYFTRDTLRKLSLHAQTMTADPTFLTQYPRLKDIVLYTHFASDATILLSPLANSRTPIVLRSVTIAFKSQIYGQYLELHKLGAVFDAEWASPARCRVHIVLPPDTRKSSNSSDGGLALRDEIITQAFFRHKAAGKFCIGNSVQNIVF